MELRSIPVYSTVIPLTGNHLIMLIRLPITNKDLKAGINTYALFVELE